MSNNVFKDILFQSYNLNKPPFHPPVLKALFNNFSL